MNAIPQKSPDVAPASTTPKQPETKIPRPFMEAVRASTAAALLNLSVAITSPALANGELSPYEPLADASGGMTLVLKDTGDQIVPPREIVPLFKRLGYDEKTLRAVADTANKMEDARSKLGPDVVLGAMVSNSQKDKPKILKDTTNKPEEAFTALFGTSELTTTNAPAVFNRLLNKTQSIGYQKRIAELGPTTSQKWFDLFNAVVRKMPAQNAYLLSQALITTSSIYAFNNPALKTAGLSPSLVADQLHRLMLLVTDANFDVARLTYGDTLETAVSRRLPTREILKKIYGSAGITLPEHLYDIAEAGAREMGIGTESYLTTATKKQDTISKEKVASEKEKVASEKEKVASEKEKVASEKEKVASEKEQRTDLMTSTNDLYKRIDTNLQAFIKNPNDSVLLANIRQDMIALRKIRTQWESLPKEQKSTESYQESMKLIANIERLLAMHKISS